MKVESLRGLLIEQCQDLYSAENQIIDALPKMIEKAKSPQLKTALNSHLGETRNHVQRLDAIIGNLRAKADEKDCKGMEGLLEEGEKALTDAKDDDVRDAAIIASAQRVEHYEIASYGTARTFAQELGMNDVAQQLQQTLDEEKNADIKLTEIATSHVNQQARKVA
jgi:ferritin-like metal-binding protein YciE